MVVKKTTKKAAKKAPAKLKVPIIALYGVPIYAAIKRGDSKEMKALAAKARKHISDVQTALAALDKKIAGS